MTHICNMTSCICNNVAKKIKCVGAKILTDIRYKQGIKYIKYQSYSTTLLQIRKMFSENFFPFGRYQSETFNLLILKDPKYSSNL